MDTKEAKMQNYKIKVTSKAESKEAQELFFALGYGWLGFSKVVRLESQQHFLITDRLKNNISITNLLVNFETADAIEITLPQLRNLVALHRNDVSDATHTDDNTYMYYEDSQGGKYKFHENHWSKLFPHEYRTAFYCLKKTVSDQPQMTWQDALRAMADGKEVLMKFAGAWYKAETVRVENIKKGEAFRLAPQYKTLNGNYTKEQLLTIAGAMV